MSNSTFNLIANLTSAAFWINHIIPIFQIIFGTFGNLLNIIIFTRRSLRTNPCSMYFLIGSINNIFVICVALIPRYLSTNWNLDPSATNNILCKLYYFFIYASLNLVLCFIVLASIDRYLSTSHNVLLRRLSSLAIARKTITFTTIFTYLYHAHILIFYKSDVSGRMIMCGIFSYQYRTFFNFFGTITACILPIILMTIFGILMILNVRNSHKRVAPQINGARNERLRSNDRQLIIMLLLQVLVTTLITVPFAVFSMASAISIIIFQAQSTTSDQTINNFVLNIFRLLYYTNPVVGFYIYTLTGSKFRAEMKRCIQYGLKSALKAIGSSTKSAIESSTSITWIK